MDCGAGCTFGNRVWLWLSLGCQSWESTAVMKSTHKTLALWILLILMFWAIYQIISQHKQFTQGKEVAPDVNYEQLAKATDGFSGGILQNLVNQAALSAAKRVPSGVGARGINAEDFEDGLTKTTSAVKSEQVS